MSIYKISIDKWEDCERLEWTIEPPKKSGWYWALSKYQKGITKIVRVVQDETEWHVFDIGLFGWFSISEFTHWLGPLPMPDPPEK